MKNILTVSTLGVALFCAALPAYAAQGYIGISVRVDGEGFFLNPTIVTAKVAKVDPDSPAHRAGIAEGDLILEVEGKRVAGSRAKDLKPYLEREVGQPLRFLLKTSSAEEKQVTVVAVPRR